MISQEEILRIHDVLIEEFGGSKGVRDPGLLDSALHRPFATFAGEFLYPEPVDRAAAILHSIALNHPFIDGNKRTAYVAMRLLLLEEGLDIQATEDAKYTMVIDVASGQMEVESIAIWIRDHLVTQ